ncbi:hypothetical protein PEC301653_32950 [Pectobacterium carotovorum subsp. carotovorum]|nr:hypothetical protein PCC21_022110 [Pectobacterium carotovorum subsp. carotovorum PCC21]GKW00250.1 hypothetical protein PEC301653_32950 [Pectobacterium carotovorum subsp. carotovorum]
MELTRFDRFNHGDERTLSTTNFTRSLLLHGQDEYAGKSLKVDDNTIHVKGGFRPLILRLDVIYCKNLGYEKTTQRWFHDTIYCFDYSCLSHDSRSEI